MWLNMHPDTTQLICTTDRSGSHFTVCLLFPQIVSFPFFLSDSQIVTEK